MRIGCVSLGSHSPSRATATRSSGSSEAAHAFASGEPHSRNSRRELQQPGEAVRTLEADAASALE